MFGFQAASQTFYGQKVNGAALSYGQDAYNQ